jgi:hypothetical protein
MKPAGLQKLDQELLSHEQWLINVVFRDKANKPTTDSDFPSKSIQYFARRNGLSPLLYHILKQSGAIVPPQFLNNLHNDYLASTFHTSRLINAANKLINESAKHRISVMPLKGVFLAQYIYPDSSLRQMSDIDLLFPYQDADKARALLLNLENTSSGDIKRVKHESDHDLHSIVFDQFLVEPHRLLLPSNLRFTIPIDEIWTDSTAIENNELIRQMNPTHLLLYLICHIHYTIMRGGIRAAWFYDLKAVLNHYQDLITHESIVQTATRWNILKPVSRTLALSNWLLGECAHASTSPFGLPKLVEAKRIALLFRKSTQQQSIFSYRLAWERLAKTKGITGKIKFIKSNLQLEKTTKNGWVFSYHTIKRILHIAFQTFKMIIVKTLEILRLR